MNIFALDTSPKTAAMYHNNSHNIKMILEQVQLLCTAHRILDGVEVQGKSKTGRKKKQWILSDSSKNDLMYSATHVNHPSAIWCRTTDENYKWLHELTIELCREYEYRYGKIHKCERIGLIDMLRTPPNNIPNGSFTPVTPAMPSEYIVENDFVASYRNYYNNGKQHLAIWSGKINGRSVPHWYTGKLAEEM
jgi:hypothetical protein